MKKASSDKINDRGTGFAAACVGVTFGRQKDKINLLKRIEVLKNVDSFRRINETLV